MSPEVTEVVLREKRPEQASLCGWEDVPLAWSRAPREVPPFSGPVAREEGVRSSTGNVPILSGSLIAKTRQDLATCPSRMSCLCQDVTSLTGRGGAVCARV